MDAEGDLIWGDEEKSLVLEQVSSSLTVLLRYFWKPKFLSSLPKPFFFVTIICQSWYSEPHGAKRIAARLNSL